MRRRSPCKTAGAFPSMRRRAAWLPRCSRRRVSFTRACSTLGICAERNAIFNMLTAGDEAIDKVLAVMPDGKTGAPCGACRELMVQLMPKSYKQIQIMLDYSTGRVVTLGELTPEWWI